VVEFPMLIGRKYINFPLILLFLFHVLKS